MITFEYTSSIIDQHHGDNTVLTGYRVGDESDPECFYNGKSYAMACQALSDWIFYYDKAALDDMINENEPVEF